MPAKAAAAAASQVSPSLFDDMFKHCHWDNPVFVHGVFWIILLILTASGKYYYHWKESQEEQEKERQ